MPEEVSKRSETVPHIASLMLKCPRVGAPATKTSAGRRADFGEGSQKKYQELREVGAEPTSRFSFVHDFGSNLGPIILRKL